MTRHNGSRAPAAHHGLRNQGATCYLNSVLQVLFMTKEFRDAVERSTARGQYIDSQLKSLFEALKSGTANTEEITKKLGIKRVYEQQDAAEFFEKILNNTTPEAAKIFQGLLTHRNICCLCDSHTNNDDPFWSLPLALVDSENSLVFSVMDGVKMFFHSVHVSGENQMYCEECDSKTDAEIDIEIKHHPDVLMLLLKRFKFDYHCKGYVKDKRDVEFPYTIQMQENQRYELYAFVEHFGSLRGGHYTATINSQDDGKWYNFNDTVVTLADYQSFKIESTEISKSAYLLFYRKIQNNPEGMQLDTRNSNYKQWQCSEKTNGRENTSGKTGATKQGNKRSEKNGQEVLNFGSDNSQDGVQEISNKPMRHEDNKVRSQNKRHTRETEKSRQKVNEEPQICRQVCTLIVDTKGDDQGRSLKTSKYRFNKSQTSYDQENQKSHERMDGQHKRGMSEQNYDKDVQDQKNRSQTGSGQEKRSNADHVERKIRGSTTDPNKPFEEEAKYELGNKVGGTSYSVKDERIAYNESKSHLKAKMITSNKVSANEQCYQMTNEQNSLGLEELYRNNSTVDLPFLKTPEATCKEKNNIKKRAKQKAKVSENHLNTNSEESKKSKRKSTGKRNLKALCCCLFPGKDTDSEGE